MTSGAKPRAKRTQARPDWHLTPDGARRALETVPTAFVDLFRHGTLEVEYYAPQGVDTQQPHRRDELYVVQAGRARFERDGGFVEAGPGDVLFAPAGMPHRFHDMSADFGTWVLFWGPEGGETP